MVGVFIDGVPLKACRRFIYELCPPLIRERSWSLFAFREVVGWGRRDDLVHIFQPNRQGGTAACRGDTQLFIVIMANPTDGDDLWCVPYKPSVIVLVGCSCFSSDTLSGFVLPSTSRPAMVLCLQVLRLENQPMAQSCDSFIHNLGAIHLGGLPLFDHCVVI